jgi:ParB family transcriptional regulator, chromosome partitioning protein
MIRKSKFRSSFLKEIDKTVKARGGNAEQDIEALNAPIDQVYPDPNQPRTDPNPEADDIVSLRRSIKSFGILEPLLVTRDKNRRYRLIAGHRRLLAAQGEKRSHVPVRVLSINEDINHIRLIQLTENLQRKDLSPIEVGLCLETILKAGKLKQVELAKKIGLSQPMVAYYLSMKKIGQKAIREIGRRPEEFTFKFLIKVARLKPESEQLKAIQNYASGFEDAPKTTEIAEPGKQLKIKARRRHKGRRFRWRPRLKFQCKDVDFDVTRTTNPEEKRIKVELPQNMDEKEILTAFKNVYRKMTGLDWSQIDEAQVNEEGVGEEKAA